MSIGKLQQRDIGYQTKYFFIQICERLYEERQETIKNKKPQGRVMNIL